MRRAVLRRAGLQLPLSVGVLCSAFVGYCHVRPLAAQRCASGGPVMTDNLQLGSQLATPGSARKSQLRIEADYVTCTQ